MNVPRPNIVWRGAHPNNFTYGRPGAGRDGRNTQHHVVGSAESAVLVFNQASRGASAHFVVTDVPGLIYQCVDLDNTAYTDGNWESNIRAVTVEHHGDWRNGYDNPTVRENSAMLAAWLRDQGIVTYPLRHRDVSQIATACPADLPVEAIWDRATEIINYYNTPQDTRPQWLKDRVDVEDHTVYAQAEGIFIRNLNNPNEPADSRRFVLNQSFLISSYTVIDGKKYWITASSTNTNAANGLLESEVSTIPYTKPDDLPPVPETPDWTDSVIDHQNRTMYVLRATPLIDLENGRPFRGKDGKEVWYEAGSIIKDISAQAIVAEVTYELTEYSFGQIQTGAPQNANGIKASDLSVDPLSTPPGTPANPEEPEDPEDPVIPMPDVPTPPIITVPVFQLIIKTIVEFAMKIIDKIFNRKK